MGARQKSTKFWDNQSKHIQTWICNKNYKVVYHTDADDRLCFEAKTIYIDSRQHAENRFYTLLHECGHLLISQTASQFAKDYPLYAFACDNRRSKSKAYQVSLVAEEIEAWKRGRRLASKFNLFVDDYKFNKVMTDCVMSYIADAATIAG